MSTFELIAIICLVGAIGLYAIPGVRKSANEAAAQKVVKRADGLPLDTIDLPDRQDSPDRQDRQNRQDRQEVVIEMIIPYGMQPGKFVEVRWQVEDKLQELFEKSILKGEIFEVGYDIEGGCAMIFLELEDKMAFLKYITSEGTLDNLLKMKNGEVCRTAVLLKGYEEDGKLMPIKIPEEMMWELNPNYKPDGK